MPRRSLHATVRLDAIRLELFALVTDPLFRLEKLRAVDEPTLIVDPAVDEIGVVERQLGGPVDDVIGRFDAQHEAVILVADLVPPAAEAAAGVNVLFLQFGQELLEDAFALEGWGWVTVVEATVVGADYFVIGFEHFGVDEALDAVGEHVGVVDWLHG